MRFPSLSRTAPVPSESAGSCTPQKAQQNGLGLIVECVRGGDAVKAIRHGGAQEELIAGAASGRFQRQITLVGKGGNIRRFRDELERELRGHFDDKALVRIRLSAAKTVIEVKDAEHHPKAGRKLVQCAQQRHRVRAPTDGHAHSRPRADETVAPEIAL